MKIRQIMIASLLLFSGTKALAQPERVSVWDGFGDNVYMDAGVGVQALFAPGWQDIAFGKQITPALNLGVGKWITPFWGLHLDVFGYSQNGYRGTPLDKGVEPFSPLNRVDVGYDGSFRYYLRYLGVRADFRLSLLNLITGCEREGALYDLVPFAGMGYKHALLIGEPRVRTCLQAMWASVIVSAYTACWMSMWMWSASGQTIMSIPQRAVIWPRWR